MRLRLLLFLVLAGYNVDSSAQKIRFVDTNNLWQVAYIFAPTAQEAYACIGAMRLGKDTALNGKTYKRMSGTQRSFMLNSSGNQHGCPLSMGGYFCEDTLIGKVWYRREDLADTTVTLIYNHNWVVGDTIPWKYGSGTKGVSRVETVDSTLLLNRWHRVFHMSIQEAPGSGGVIKTPYTIIEGIGSTCGPNFPNWIYRFEDSWDLCAFYTNGYLPVVSPPLSYFSNTGNCNSLSVENSAMSLRQPPIVVNPATATTTLELPLPLSAEGYSLILTDGIGRTIAVYINLNSKKIQLGQCLNTPGIYYYLLRDIRSGQQYSGRFIFR